MPAQRAAPPPDADEPLPNARIAAVLAEIGDLLELKGESAFKVGAYRRAADSVARSPVDVAGGYRAGQPPRLRGVGDTIAERIAELALGGRSGYHEALREEVPATLLAFLAVPGVGPRTAGDVWRELGISTLGELEAAARAGRLRQVRGISARTEERIVAGIGELARRPARRLLMGEAHALAAQIVELASHLPGVISATATGSVRRMSPTVGDLDVLIETERPADVFATLAAMPASEPGAVAARGHGGHGRITVQLRAGPRLDVMTMPAGVSGTYLVHFTGSAEHNVALRHRARQRGWSLSEHGVMPLEAAGHDVAPETVAPETVAPASGAGPDAGGSLPSAPAPRTLAGPDAGGSLPSAPAPRTFASEAALYAFLGLAEVPPELREGRGEVEAAAAGLLPRLVDLGDLRGDCHSHSDWSDGREAIEVMAESARRAGRQYQVLTDHSASLGVANGLTPDRVDRQRLLIGEINARLARQQDAGQLPEGAHPDGFRLLHGCEVEITVDGRLDYDDALLASFDVVVASLHVGRRQPRSRLMARYDTAMRSPHVDIISHPSGRKIGQRPDLDLDWPSFYGLAAETGTLLEINGSEERLDLDEERVRAALEAGCGFVISSDAHDRSEWQNLVWGVAIARRGWLEPGRVANALPIDGFLGLMSEKPHRLDR